MRQTRSMTLQERVDAILEVESARPIPPGARRLKLHPDDAVALFAQQSPPLRFVGDGLDTFRGMLVVADRRLSRITEGS